MNQLDHIIPSKFLTAVKQHSVVLVVIKCHIRPSKLSVVVVPCHLTTPSNQTWRVFYLSSWVNMSKGGLICLRIYTCWDFFLNYGLKLNSLYAI